MTNKEKMELNIELLYRWIRLGQSGIKPEKLLEERGIRSIIIYGFNDLGVCMLYELHDSKKITVVGIADRDIDNVRVDYNCIFVNSVSLNKYDCKERVAK